MDIWITIIWCVCVRADKVANDITTKQLPAHSDDKRERERHSYIIDERRIIIIMAHINYEAAAQQRRKKLLILSTRREGGRLKIYAGSSCIIFWCIWSYTDAVCLSVQFSRDDYISGKYHIAASAYSTSKRREMISTVFFFFHHCARND